MKKYLLSVLALSIVLGAVGCAHTKTADNCPVAVAPEPDPAVPFVELTMENLQKEVLESPLPVLVWVCHEKRGACKLSEPALRKLAPQYKGRVVFAHVEVSRQVDLAIAMGITSGEDLPLHVFVKGGEALFNYRGVLDADELRRGLDEMIAYKPPANPNTSTK